ncbi:MAG: DUF2125 domain-containing protein [Rhodospirillaceae bacterium]|jgi:hypothetical protein|nr:DUF2125 domain-containing protein [Rhodospirillaceae bacterium]MBT5898112.1 DUF2125 domain-containing protein [Rhodospirillaceae bacterium]MBT6428111.1 DUF2125 domain-containing protein [Rhodospirillaceae bacterium]MBT7759587.1 DUF2125 domain-containing protein [Rhodospirillaceae bacterium]
MRYYVLIGVVIAVVAAWTGVWFYIAGEVRQQTQASADQITDTYKASHGGFVIGGYPFRIRVDISRPRLDLRDNSSGFLWETDDVSGVRHLWQPRHILLDLSGQHRFTLAHDGAWYRLELDNSEAMASVQTDAAGQMGRLSLDIKEPLLGYSLVPALEETLQAAGRARRLQIHARMTPDASGDIDVALRGDGLEIGEGVLPDHLAAVSRTIPLLDLQTTVTGLSDHGPSTTPIAQWRDDGGTIEVRRFHLQWGDMELTASGSLALDERMRPIGALTARIKGHDQLLDIAVATKSMDKNGAIAARAVLGLLAAAGGGVLSVPVRLQDGQLFLGPAAVANLGALAVQ